MSLQYMGRSVVTATGKNFEAKNDNGEQIVVEASQEALEDHGETAVLSKGRQKYAAGQVDGNKVTVRTTDF